MRPEFRTLPVYCVNRHGCLETLVRLRHLKGNPGRVNPLRATTRAQTGAPTASILSDSMEVASSVRAKNMCSLPDQSLVGVVDWKRFQDLRSCPGDPGAFKAPSRESVAG